MNKQTFKERYSNIIILSFTLILLLPVFLYLYKFGFHLSSEHQRWAEFGSALSGIYSPLIAFIALLILAEQFKAQVSLNKHQYDQTFIQESRRDLNYYIEKIEEALEKEHQDQTVREFLASNFAYATDKEFNDATFLESAKKLNIAHPKILNMWLAIYPILKGLGTPNSFPYEHNFHSSLLRVSSMLSLNTCMAIDNYYYLLTNDIQKGKYFFKEKNEI